MYFINSSIFGVQISQTHFILLICYESANQNIEPQCIPTPAKIEHDRVLLYCHALFLEMRHLYFFPISMGPNIFSNFSVCKSFSRIILKMISKPNIKMFRNVENNLKNTFIIFTQIFFIRIKQREILSLL